MLDSHKMAKPKFVIPEPQKIDDNLKIGLRATIEEVEELAEKHYKQV